LQRQKVLAHDSGGLFGLACGDVFYDALMVIVVTVQALVISCGVTHRQPAWITADGIDGIEQSKQQPVTGGIGNCAVKCAVPQFNLIRIAA